MKPICWLGSLHYGNYISLEQLEVLYDLLISASFDIYVDTSVMYGSGKSLSIIKSLCQSFPSIKLSVKYGLVPRLGRNQSWGVDIATDSDPSLTQTMQQYLECLPLDNIYSFQFHAINSALIEDWVFQLSKFTFLQSYGVSNLSVSEANLVRDIGLKYQLNFIFSQVHANIIEQKILNEYLVDGTWSHLICNRSLARGFLSDRFVHNHLSSDSRLLNSDRVINSLLDKHKQFIKELSVISDSFHITLSQLSYIYLMFNSPSHAVMPIISPKSLQDLVHYVNIFSMPKDMVLALLSSLNDLIESRFDFLTSYPLHYLEK